jgi:hypothetical protein
MPPLKTRLLALGHRLLAAADRLDDTVRAGLRYGALSWLQEELGAHSGRFPSPLCAPRVGKGGLTH